MVEAVIFDFDGVLVHTNEFHYLAWKQLTDRLGIPFDETVNGRLLGLSREDSLDVVLERSATAFSPAQKQALCDEKNLIYRSYLATMTPKDVPPDVLPALCALRKMGLKLAVGSSSKNARFLLDKLQLTTKFDVVVDGTEVMRGKPDPEVFLKTAAKLGTPPQSCLVVEDAEAGVVAADNCGMISVAVGYAATCGKAKFNLHSLFELAEVVEKMNCVKNIVATDG